MLSSGSILMSTEGTYSCRAIGVYYVRTMSFPLSPFLALPQLMFSFAELHVISRNSWISIVFSFTFLIRESLSKEIITLV